MCYFYFYFIYISPLPETDLFSSQIVHIFLQRSCAMFIYWLARNSILFFQWNSLGLILHFFIIELFGHSSPPPKINPIDDFPHRCRSNRFAPQSKFVPTVITSFANTTTTGEGSLPKCCQQVGKWLPRLFLLTRYAICEGISRSRFIGGIEVFGLGAFFPPPLRVDEDFHTFIVPFLGRLGAASPGRQGAARRKSGPDHCLVVL